MFLRFTLFALLTLLPLTAFAEIEKVAIPRDNKMALYWWPKITIPKGWHQDKEQSYQNNINAMAPDGYTFVDAETVMYARADFKPRIPDVKSIEQLIDNDKRNLLFQIPDIEITEVDSLVTKDGKSLRSLVFKPKNKGNWERVTYGEEGDFYLIFTVSSRTQDGYNTSVSAYESLTNSFKKK
jgi:hypothetical protein